MRARKRSSTARRRRVVVGLDGSRHASHVIARLAGWAGGGRATVVRVVEPRRLTSVGLVPAATRGALLAAAQAELAARIRIARREVEAAAARLRRAGWAARAAVRVGVPLAELLAAVREERADILAIGARGAGGAKRLLLGSVADAALKQARAAVLIVR